MSKLKSALIATSITALITNGCLKTDPTTTDNRNPNLLKNTTDYIRLTYDGQLYSTTFYDQTKLKNLVPISGTTPTFIFQSNLYAGDTLNSPYMGVSLYDKGVRLDTFRATPRTYIAGNTNTAAEVYFFNQKGLIFFISTIDTINNKKLNFKLTQVTSNTISGTFDGIDSLGKKITNGDFQLNYSR